jgi:hypothetical protein
MMWWRSTVCWRMEGEMGKILGLSTTPVKG